MTLGPIKDISIHIFKITCGTHRSKGRECNTVQPVKVNDRGKEGEGEDSSQQLSNSVQLGVTSQIPWLTKTECDGGDGNSEGL